MKFDKLFESNLIWPVLFCSHPRPDVLDLCSDHSLHRVLVPIPVLSASIDDCTVGAFDYIPREKKH